MVAGTIALGLVIRLPFLPVDFHTTTDLEVYRSWARAIDAFGLAAIYDHAEVEYPPLLLYLFGLAGLVEAQLPGALRGEAALTALVKVPAALADVLTAAVIAWAVRKEAPLVRVMAPAVYLFNPAIWYDSAHWGQTDSVYTLFLVASVVCLLHRRSTPAWALYALAVCTKPQAVALAPFLVAVTVVRFGIRPLLQGAAAGTAVAAVVHLPWAVSGNLWDALSEYADPAQERPRIVVDAYNFWYLVRLGNVHDVSSALHPLGSPLSYRALAVGVYALFVALAVWLLWRRRGAPPALGAAVLALGFYALLPQMRERYLFPVLAMLLLAAVTAREPAAGVGAARRSLWWTYGLVSLTLLFNLVTTAPFWSGLPANLVTLRPDDPGAETWKALALLVAALNTALLVWLVAELARWPDGGLRGQWVRRSASTSCRREEAPAETFRSTG